MKKKQAAGRSLEDFRKEFDPKFVLQTPRDTFSRKLRSNRFIITAAQNATPVDPFWWRVIESMAQHYKAEILVIPLRYKNPTSSWSGSQRNMEWWVDEVRPFLWNVSQKLNDNLMVLGDFKIQPTAESPLTGAEALSTHQSGIIGHTKLQMKTVATPSNKMAKILTTTGACTVENYTDSRSGRVGQFHHSLSAVLVEVDGKRFHLRHVHYDKKTKSATDLDVRFTQNGPAKAPRPLALIMGDTHVDSICPRVEAATFGPSGIVQTLEPQNLIWHDLLDGYSCNPHHKGNPFNALAKRKFDRDDVQGEVSRAISFVRDHTPSFANSIIVGSNHNDFLQRWVGTTDWRTDPTNAAFYLETALMMVRGTKMSAKGTEYPDPFKYWAEKAQIPQTRVLDVDESFALAGVELGMHGNMGPNGARGSIRNLRRIGVKSVVGHSHSPGIDEGCYQVGTSTRLRLEYNHGPSGWLNCHGLLHADGKRQLLVIVDGDWRLDT